MEYKSYINPMVEYITYKKLRWYIKESHYWKLSHPLNKIVPHEAMINYIDADAISELQVILNSISFSDNEYFRGAIVINGTNDSCNPNALSFIYIEKIKGSNNKFKVIHDIKR